MSKLLLFCDPSEVSLIGLFGVDCNQLQMGSLSIASLSVTIIQSMQRRIRQFDIITGVPNLPNINRSLSQPTNPLLSIPRMPSPRKLGLSRDQHSFQYAYFDKDQGRVSVTGERGLAHSTSGHSEGSSMLNCVSTPYNLISHARQHPTSKVITRELFNQRLPGVNKKSPLTEHLEAGKIFSPNYRSDYPEREARHEFHRKSHSFCEQICENEKRSAGRFFRKYK